MEITPLLPDGFTGTIKQRTCALCYTQFYVPLEYYRAYKPVFCHDCSIKQKEKERVKHEKEALKAKDTPDEAIVRAFVENIHGREKGYEMFLCLDISDENGRRWKAYSRKRVGKHRGRIVCDVVAELTRTESPDAIVNSYFVYNDWEPPYSYPIHDEEDISKLRDTLNQMTHLPQEERTAWVKKWLTTDMKEENE